MVKRGKKLFIRNTAIFEIILLVSVSFAIAFILEENLISAQLINPSGSAAAATASSQSTIAAGSTIYSGTYTAGEINVIGGTLTKATTGEVISTNFIANSGSPVTISPASGGGTLINHGGENFILKEGSLQAGSAVVGTPIEHSVNLGITSFSIGSGPLAFFTAHLIEGVVWGGVVALGIKFLGPMLGMDEKQADAAALAAFGGIAVGKAVYGAFAKEGLFGLLETGSLELYTLSIGAGALVAFAILVAMYKKEKKKLVEFTCLPFEPPIKGEKCEECNKDLFRPCSEYRCRSLGQACQLLDKGSSEERCAWVNPKDVVSPTITAWDDALKPLGLKYIPDNAIRPPNRGVKIISGKSNGCLEPFTKLEFGFNLNEPSQCKIDYEMGKGFDELKYYVGGSNYHRYNHTQKMKLPGPVENMSEETTPELKNDGTFSLFVRCKDPNGNENVDAFVFSYCVDQSPDTTPPLIEGTSIISGSYVRTDAESTPIEVYVNEPAECKWSKASKSYDEMENKMNCATEPYQINADMNYVCKGNLTITEKGKGTESKYYFRCKDGPGKEDKDRNVMTESHELTLKGSNELNIVDVGPKGTIYGNTKTIKAPLTVRTDDGAEEGKAICYLSRTNEKDSYIAMSETNNYIHKQELELTAGSYKYYFRCVDSGGNSAENMTEFNVALDADAPLITRVFKEGKSLKLVTNEDAECVYNLKDCNYVFKEGLKMEYSNPSIRKVHFKEWKEDSVFYIKCGDFNGNKPLENECSIIVKNA